MIKRSNENSQEDRPKLRQPAKKLKGYRMEIGGQLRSENWGHIDIDDEIVRGRYVETSHPLGCARFFMSQVEDEQAQYCILLSELLDTEHQRWIMFPDAQRFDIYCNMQVGSIISGTLHRKLPN